MKLTREWSGPKLDNIFLVLRCETTYRILYTISIQWRNYLMLCGDDCYYFFDKDLDCAIMVCMILVTVTTSHMFVASNTAIRWGKVQDRIRGFLHIKNCLIMPFFRCLFLKYGTQTAVTAPIKVSSFFNAFFTICHAAMLYNICSYIWIFYGNSEGQRNHFLLYHVCYDPNQKYSSSIFTAMPVSTLLIVISNIVLIGGSFYLFRFLQSNLEKRAGEKFKIK